jgi:transcriptional regulator
MTATGAKRGGEPDLDLLQGPLDILVLRALTFGPMHGYAIARFIRDGSNGTFRILDGALYTALHRMEEREWLAAEWGSSDRGKRAKFYRLTPSGRRALRRETAEWDEYVSAFARVMRATPAGGNGSGT